jgi:membrane protein
MWTIAATAKREADEDNISLIAAGVAFYGFLALVPGLATLIFLYGLLFDSADVVEQIRLLSQVAPRQVTALLSEQLDRLVSTTTPTLGAGALTSAAVTLWSTSKGTRAMIKAMNAVYGTREKRGIVHLYALSLLFTLGTLVGGTIALALLVALPAITSWLGLGGVKAVILELGRWAVLTALAAAGIAALYRFGPDRPSPPLVRVAWGAGAATVLWLALSFLLQWYVATVGQYSASFGSISAVVVLLLWLYLSALAVLLGGVINSSLTHVRKQRRPQTPPPRDASPTAT